MRIAGPDRSEFGTALVLGGGGMFGAYEAGVWRTLCDSFRPDIVIGASIGAINGWAIAGGCDPDDLVRDWLDFKEASANRIRFPRNLRDGLIDRAGFEDFIRRHHTRYTPRVPCGVAVTYIRPLSPACVLSPDVAWRHLAASCAVPVVFPAYRLEGGLAVDGGLLTAVPLWAARQLGVRRAVAVNILPRSGPWWLRGGRRLLHAASAFEAPGTDGMEVELIEHPAPLGSMRDTAVWDAGKAARWVELGRQDASKALSRIRAWSTPQTS